MAQHRSGLIRVLDGQVSVLGSWSATVTVGNPAALQGDPTFETVTFSGGATGIFIDDFNNGNQVKFFVTSGTPGDGETMTGDSSLVQITIGNPVNETKWLTNAIAAPHQLLVGSDKFATPIASVGAEDALTLVAPGYQGGSDKVGVPYAVLRDFTGNRSYPLLTPGDLQTMSIYSNAMNLIDADIDAALQAGGVDPPEVWQNPSPPVDGGTWTQDATVQHRKYQTWVELQGIVRPVSSVADSTAIFTLDSGEMRRPLRNKRVDRGTYSIEITSGGIVRYRGPTIGSTQSISLDMILFRGEQ